MIGGRDTITHCADSLSAMDICARLAMRHWPNAVFENAVTGQQYDRYCDVPFGQIEELFIYCDHKARGGDVMLAKTIYLLRAPGEVTIVWNDSKDAGLRQMIGDMQSAVERQRRQQVAIAR